MGPVQLNAEACTRPCASAQRHAGPTLERGNNECRPDTRSLRQSDRPPVRPRRRRPPAAPVRLHDGRHRSRAGDGRLAPGARGTPDPVFTVDNEYVDLGASSAAEVQGLGIAVLAPVSLAKRPQLYGERLLAAPVAGRRAACAALAAAVQAKPKVKGTVVVAFTVQSLYTSN